MPAKLAPPPPVAPETWRALLAAAAEFAALKPWAFACDNDSVGLIDPVTGETRIGHVLGNAGEVFAAVFYRRGGLRWILTMFSDSLDPENLNHLDGMDCLKLALCPSASFGKKTSPCSRPPGSSRSAEPGLAAISLHRTRLASVAPQTGRGRPTPRRSAASHRVLPLFAEHPNLYEGRGATEIPFLPAAMPDRPLTPGDLDWRPLLPPPSTALEPFQAGGADLERLRRLRRAPELAYEFDCTLLPGGSFVENGRPCFGRFSLLVEKQSGLIAGMEVASGALTPGEAAGRALVKTLLMAKPCRKNSLSAARACNPCCNRSAMNWALSCGPCLRCPRCRKRSNHSANGWRGPDWPAEPVVIEPFARFAVQRRKRPQSNANRV